MILKYHTLNYPLDQFIEYFQYYDGYMPTHTREKLLPDGAVEIIIDLSEHPKKLFDNSNPDNYTSFKDSWVSGMRSNYILIQASGPETAMLVIRFKPGGAFPFFRFPLRELRDKIIPLDLIWGQSIVQLRQQLLETKDVNDKFNSLEKYFYDKSKNYLEVNPYIDYAVNSISQFSHNLFFKHLNDKLGISQKHLIHTFNKWVGITPKVYNRIVKFQVVIHKIEHSDDNLNWSSIAHDCGYYDQAHFIKEFQSFSGFNPTSYLNAKGEFTNYIPLD